MAARKAVWVPLALAATIALVFCLAGLGTAAPGAPIRVVRTQAQARAALPAPRHSFYASPSGSPSGDGSAANPWDLATTLAQPAALEPGDIVWLRGGTYRGSFSSRLNGEPDNPITVRQYPGERATIDLTGSGELNILSTYAVYWGFEVTNSDPNRPNVSFSRPPGFTVTTANNTFVNLVVHDTGQGFGFWVGATDSEISGCLIYYNGNATLDHGIYSQNQTGTKRIVDNILFNNYGHGLHIYGSDSAYLDNFIVDGNTSFDNGLLSTGKAQRNLLLGGSRVAQSPVVTNNYLYYPPGGPVSALDLGYSAGCANATVTGNYVANNAYFVNCLPVTMTGNTFYGTTFGFSPTRYPNTYFSHRPSGSQVFIRPNAYEPGRANVTIFNWSLLDNVDVDLSTVLGVGDKFEIRNATDFFSAPVAAGTYAGGAVSFPMTGLSMAPPVGFALPESPAPDFGAFVLITTEFGRESPVPPAARPRPRVEKPVERPGL